MSISLEVPTAAQSRDQSALNDHQRILVLIEEYRALYGLLAFRLGAVDRRLPVAGGTFGALLGGFAALPPDTQVVVLLATPVALTWLFRTTVSHARSKEDVLRRIDEIERQVNQIAGEELISFQSRHPSRGRRVSGRSGLSSVLAVLMFVLCGLAACGYLVGWHTQLLSAATMAYWTYLAAALVNVMHCAWRLHRYRYEKSPAERSPLFVGRGG